MSSQETKSSFDPSASDIKTSSTEAVSPRLKFISKGDEYFSLMLSLIKEARHEILLESYIFNLDLVGEQIFKALLDAHSRGVQVRLLIDGIGSFNWLNALQGRARATKLPLRVYHPVPFQMGLISRLSWKNLRRLLLTFRRLNKRNHRKVILVDQKQALVGSYNVSQVHSEHWNEGQAWKDCAIALAQDRDLVLLRRSFLKAWKRSRSESAFDEKSHSPRSTSWGNRGSLISSRFRLNDSWRNRRLLYKDLKKKIRSVKGQIHILNPYFLPRPSLLSLLTKASQRGVQVSLCVPQRSDIRVVQLASRYLYHRLLKNGVRVYEYKPTTLHAKILILDTWATVGSQNLNYRSLVHDLEADVVLTSSDPIWQDLQSFVKVCHQSSEEMSLLQQKNSWWENILGLVIYQLRYWL